MQQNSGRPKKGSNGQEAMKALQMKWEEQARNHGMSKKKIHHHRAPPPIIRPPAADLAPKVKMPWQGWNWDAEDGLTDTPSKAGAVQVIKPKISRPVLWRNSDGRFVVVEGPFPAGFFRGGTRSSVDKARKTLVNEMYAHDASGKDGWFALVLAEDVVEVFTGENEFGTVCP